MSQQIISDECDHLLKMRTVAIIVCNKSNDKKRNQVTCCISPEVQWRSRDYGGRDHHWVNRRGVVVI